MLIPEGIQEEARDEEMGYFLSDWLSLIVGPICEVDKTQGHSQNQFPTTKRICNAREKVKGDGKASFINLPYSTKHRTYFSAFYSVVYVSITLTGLGAVFNSTPVSL